MTPEKVAVVVSTRSKSRTEAFLDAWSEELRNARILIVEDNPASGLAPAFAGVTSCSWRDVDLRLGHDSWIIPRRTSCVRSFGYFIAALDAPDMIVSLHEDCRPDPESPGFLARHWARLSGLDGGLPGREPGANAPGAAGERTIVLNQGFCVPGGPGMGCPEGSLPICPRNLAFRPGVAPALYFLLMGREYECDGLGNIWSGILLSRILAHLGGDVTSGGPGVLHLPERNPAAERDGESSDLNVIQRFTDAVDRVELTKMTCAECYAELADGLPLGGDYWTNLRQAMKLWAALFEDVETFRSRPWVGEMAVAA